MDGRCWQIGLAGVAAAMQIDAASLAGVVFGFPLLSASIACVVIGAASPRTWLGRFAVPGARLIAVLSFSLYLTRKQVYYWLHGLAGETLEKSDLVAFAAYNGAAFAVAALLYAAVERPGLRMRERGQIRRT